MARSQSSELASSCDELVAMSPWGHERRKRLALAERLCLHLPQQQTFASERRDFR